MVHLGLWKGLSKDESLELGSELRVGRFYRQEDSSGSKLETDKTMKLNEHSPKEFKLCFGIFYRRGCMMFDMCRAKLKGKRGVYCKSDGTQKLLSCMHSGILQAANAVHLTAVLCDLPPIQTRQKVEQVKAYLSAVKNLHNPLHKAVKDTKGCRLRGQVLDGSSRGLRTASMAADTAPAN